MVWAVLALTMVHLFCMYWGTEKKLSAASGKFPAHLRLAHIAMGTRASVSASASASASHPRLGVDDASREL